MREKGFRDSQSNTNRLSDFEDYLFLVKYLIKKGYTVVKMGKGVKQNIDFNHSNFIDYAGKYHDDYLDVWLCSNCLFFINIASGGLVTIPLVFRKPILCLNYDVFSFWSAHKNVLTGFKKILKNLEKMINISLIVTLTILYIITIYI